MPGRCELCDEYCDRLYKVKVKTEEGNVFSVSVCADCKEQLKDSEE